MTPRRLIEPARLAGTAVLRTQSDDRLVDLVREGNDRAFEAIVHRYRGPLLRYCQRFLSPARAEDAVQQTFVNAVAAIRDGDAEINLRPWLYRIAHNAALNVLRQAGADHEQISEQIDGVETPPQALERGEHFRTVVAAVRELPDRQRDALVLQALEGRSYDEIATELGVTGGAVRQLLNRARTTLRQGVTALTPPALVARLGGGIEAPVTERVAQVVGGAGAGAALAKLAAIVATTGAVVGGAADGILSQQGARDSASARATPAVADGSAAKPIAAAQVPVKALRVSATKPRRRSAGVTSHRRGHSGSNSGTSAPTRDHHGGAHSGEGRGGSRSDDSGRGGDRSGHHDGSDDSTPTTLTDDHSGPGSGGSGSSGSGGSDDGATTTGLSGDSSGSDGSGSGSGDSRISTEPDDDSSG